MEGDPNTTQDTTASGSHPDVTVTIARQVTEAIVGVEPRGRGDA